MRRFVALALCLAVAAGACRRGEPAPGDAPPTAEQLPAFSFREDTPGLLFTWVDDRGDAHTALTVGEVPVEGRALVRVVRSDSQAGAGDVFYVADLRAKDAGGAYATRSMSRADWATMIDEKRSKYLARVAPPVEQGRGSVTAIVYGASWCKPCHDAEAYLRKRGAWVVMKDIEQSQAAATEMREKLDKAGRKGGDIPVIDIRGRILVGFSAREVDRALEGAKTGTTL